VQAYNRKNDGGDNVSRGFVYVQYVFAVAHAFSRSSRGVYYTV